MCNTCMSCTLSLCLKQKVCKLESLILFSNMRKPTCTQCPRRFTSISFNLRSMYTCSYKYGKEICTTLHLLNTRSIQPCEVVNSCMSCLSQTRAEIAMVVRPVSGRPNILTVSRETLKTVWIRPRPVTWGVGVPPPEKKRIKKGPLL